MHKVERGYSIGLLAFCYVSALCGFSRSKKMAATIIDVKKRFFTFFIHGTFLTFFYFSNVFYF